MLTDTKLRKLKPPPASQKTPDKYSDEKGLQLHVFANGGMYWRMAYRFEGKQKTYSIGVYPDVSLADARRARDDARRQIADGVDPSQAKKQAKRRASGADSFQTLAAQWMASRAVTVGTLARDQRILEKDLFPFIGHLPIDEIKGRDILAAAEKIEGTGATEKPRRMISLAGSVFRYAMRRDLVQHDPTYKLSEGLKAHRVTHMARIEQKELPQLLHDIDHYTGDILTRLGLQLMALLFVRTKELRFMEWQEIDRAASLWRIPADKMKMGKPHLVPLCRQALALLDALQPHTGHTPFVFFSARSGQPLSDMTLLTALWRMGYKGRMTGHGFRGLASTSLHEQGYNHDAIELQLAHTKRDKVSAAYDHSKHLPYRTKMMQEWADYLDELRQGQVIRFPKATA